MTVTEQHFLDGKLHRDGAPAVIERKSDGSTTEKYYRNGELFRPDVPTPVVIERNTVEDSTTEKYAREGKVYRSVTEYGPRSPMRSGNRQKPNSPTITP
jgi:hypothetical protein